MSQTRGSKRVDQMIVKLGKSYQPMDLPELMEAVLYLRMQVALLQKPQNVRPIERHSDFVVASMIKVDGSRTRKASATRKGR